MTARITGPVFRGLAFMAGVGFAALPAVGPFLALIAILIGRLQVQRADAWWWLAAAMLSLPFVVTGHAPAAMLSFAQVMATWLIFRSATHFRTSVRHDKLSTDIGAGLVVGLLITLAMGLRNLGDFRFDVAVTILDAIVWNTHPALFGHAILVLSALLALVVPSPRLRVVSLAIGAVGVIFSGSREAVWVWLIIALGLRFVGRRATRATRIAEWSLVVVMAVIVSGLASVLGLGRIGFLTDFAPQGENPNLFRGTEVAAGDWWLPLGVEFRVEAVNIGGVERAGYTVTKAWTEPWARIQQAVTLTPGETYTLSAVLRSPDGTRPGFDGWGRTSPDVEAANLGTVFDGDVHRATVTGPLSLISTSAITIDDTWNRLFATFRYEGESPITWYVGVVPDRSNRTGVGITFSELQLTSTHVNLPYRPGIAERGVTDLRTSRFPVWRDSLEAIGARPLLGWGPAGLPQAVQALRPDETLLRPIAAHAHNAFLAAWVERGLIGVIGLVGLLGLLGLRAVQQRDRAAAVVLVGVTILNFFDSTLLSGAVIYPLAAVLGWRAVGHRDVAKAETGIGSAVGVRVGLMLSDLCAGATALSLGLYFAAHFDSSTSLASGWSVPLVYASFIWPIAAATSRLYPGYGRPSHQELAYSVRSAAAAGVLVGFLVLLLPDVFGLTTPVLVVALPASVLLSPLFRSVTKLALRRLRLWGRPVVILGTEPDAARVARHLLGHPGLGLHPVAAFGTPNGWSVRNLPITGGLDQAWDYLKSSGVRHAIITKDAATTAAFDQVLLRFGTRLKYVQYLPDLRGLPTYSVVAAPLGTALALEARNQLASSTNRAAKRAMDFLGSALLLITLAIPLVAISLMIRIDSRGPAFYFSPRVGRSGGVFKCIKFRTMHQDAEKRLFDLLAANPELQAEYDRFHKLENDPRVTRVGRILRRLSIDELPQLINVLLGEMSLVGPRPYLVRELDLMGSERDLIFLARPGMTGYWQVEARNDVSFEERQTMEAHYVRNWSVWWDIEILLRTPGVMIGKTGR